MDSPNFSPGFSVAATSSRSENVGPGQSKQTSIPLPIWQKRVNKILELMKLHGLHSTSYLFCSQWFKISMNGMFWASVCSREGDTSLASSAGGHSYAATLVLQHMGQNSPATLSQHWQTILVIYSYLVRLTTEKTLSLNRSMSTSRLMCSHLPLWLLPALLMRTSSFPNLSRTDWKQPWWVEVSHMSMGRTITSGSEAPTAKHFFLTASKIFGCESSPISHNVHSLLVR